MKTMHPVFVTALAETLICAALQAATTFTVTTINDGGAGSLRQAIASANAAPGPDMIVFNIPPDDGTVKTILITNALPTITGPVVIDGYTQPGASVNTMATADNAKLLIEITSTNNRNGLIISAGDSTVRGLVLNRLQTGITLETRGSNIIEGNFIGTDPTGTIDRGNNGFGVWASTGSPTNTIGGLTPAARNVIAGNENNGIRLGTSGNIVQGNFIGPNVTGTNALPNTQGIYVGANRNLIGGAVAGAGNVISGNNGDGIQVVNASFNLIQGNLIGTDPTGTRAMGNAGNGVSSIGGLDGTNVIGGTSAAARNIISGNNQNGLNLGNPGNIIQGNFIGTDITGIADLGNGNYGVHLGVNSDNILIGGAAAGAQNLISGNENFGINLSGAGSTNMVQGNRIGTDVTGESPLPNSRGGVRIFTSRSNRIGGSAAGEGNRIAFNMGPGIAIEGGNDTNNVISGNSIFGNTALGIDLLGPRTNDTCDVDTGPNRHQNFPVLTNATVGLAGVTIQGFMPGAANTTYTLEFFANLSCDPSGHGEGQIYLGSATVTTGPSCTNTFTANLVAAVPCRFYATATATDQHGNTSEFSACFLSVGVDTDGDGACDLEEVLAHTDPNDTNSVFRITSITREGDDIRVAWQGGGGTTNILQTTTGTPMGALIGNFTDAPPGIELTGAGDVLTNHLHMGGATNRARYYRVRLVR
ncbi:MAG: hypothetical protein L0Y58_06550 [Verrucomicrobia subdivision 3 bacterium]|nr:hypothetical protein [Limisphaerales bacterium]